jgi:RNA polymerase sigma factor (sigma-70 family)
MPPHASTLLCHLRRLTSPSPSDAALLARWTGQRDEAAFAALVARHGPMVLGACRRLLGDVQHAEDAFQATFLALARQAPRLRRPEALASFLYGVALRLGRKARGAARRRPVQPCPNAPEPADPHPDPLDVLSGRELLALIDAEVARLPEAYRLPLLLCVMQGRPVEEAAQVLGWSTGSVRGRLARGRERLRERLSRRGLTLSVGAVALSAPAAVPERLLAEAVRNLGAPARAAVSALAAGLARPLKLKLLGLGLGLVLAAAGLGAGLPFLRAPELKTAATEPAAPAGAKEESGRDRHGDPLPAGAVLRLGTVRYRIPGETQALAFAPDGKTLAICAGHLFLMDPATGKRVGHRIEGFSWARDKPIAFSPDGKRLAGLGRVRDGQKLKGVVRLWELADGSKPKDYDAEHAAWAGWSANNEPLAVCLEDGALRLDELTCGRSRRFECKDLRKPEWSDYVRCTCAPSGKALAVVDEPGVVHVWDTATGRERCAVRPEGNPIYSLAFSPDGRTLATLTRDAAQLWDAATGQALHTVATDQKYLTTVALAPDGKTIATAGDRGSASGTWRRVGSRVARRSGMT